MLFIGGFSNTSSPATHAYEVKNCGIIKTDILLPFAMAGHSCTVNKKNLYVCSSEFGGMEKNCTVYDGKSFSKFDIGFISSTSEQHILGALVSMNGSLIIMGGELNHGTDDTNNVEIFNEVKRTWVESPYMPSEMRLFTAITINDYSSNAAVYVFGGYRAGNDKKILAVWYWNGYQWKWPGQDLTSPRQGHRTIHYMGGLLHIGGSDEQLFERWMPTKNGFEIEVSKHGLTNYTYFPESFLVPDNFCQ